MRGIIFLTMGILLFVIVSSLSVLAEEEGSAFVNYCQSQYGNLDTCRKEQAIKRDDPSYCRNIETVSTRNGCYNYFAKKRNDVSYCMYVRQERNNFESIYKCYEPFITSMGNLTLCDSFERDEETQDLCYDRIYDVEENVTICPKFHDPKKKIKCYMEAASDTYDFRYCDAIKKEIDTNQCKELEIEQCDTTAHLNEVVDACKYEAALGQRRDKCNAYENEKDAEFTEGEGGNFLFKHDDPSTETFAVNVQSIDLTTSVATVELSAKKHTVPYHVRIGNIITHEFVNMYIVNILKEQEEPTEEVPEPPITKKVELCFFREPKAKPKEEPKKEEKNETLEEPEINVSVPPPAEEAPEENVNEEVIEEEAVEEEYEKPQEGVLHRVLRWFWGLFGIGKEKE